MDETDIAKAEERGLQVVQSGLARISGMISAKPAEPVTDCVDCGDEIPVARLKAAPWTTRCVHCQTMAERP
jgi:DnaK suppressor protein